MRLEHLLSGVAVMRIYGAVRQTARQPFHPRFLSPVKCKGTVTRPNAPPVEACAAAGTPEGPSPLVLALRFREKDL